MSKLFNFHSRKRLRQKLRQQSTFAEKALWHCLRRSQMSWKFRRQQGIGKYVVDFYCPQLQLIIEVDGESHFSIRRSRADQIRQKWLEAHGLHVIRFQDNEIINSIDDVLMKLYKECERLRIGLS